MNTQPGRIHGDSPAALGAELRVARERRSLSLHQASQELHIGDAVLEALERGDYAALDAPIFVRGHLRAYARLLGLDEGETLARYEEQGDKPAVPPLVTQKLDNRVHRLSGQIVSLLVIVALLVLGVLWWLNRPAPVANRVAAQTAAVPEAKSAPVVPPAQNAVQPSLAAENPAASTVPIPAPSQADALPHHAVKTIELPPKRPRVAAEVPRKTVAPASSPALPQTHVQFTLNQASWIEVYDASGKRLYYDLAPAGETVGVSGAGPLQVFLGNAPGVSVRLEGAKFDQSPYTRADNTARFRIGAPDKPDQNG